jgi:hypothetical protein
LLGLQLLLCVLAALSPFLGDCRACSRGPGTPAILGILFYSALLAGVLLRGFSPEVLLGVFFGAGVHAALVLQMLLRGPLCGLCLAAAVVSAAMVGVSFALDQVRIGRLAVVAPAAAMLATTGWTATVPVPMQAAEERRVRIAIFTQPDCPYCEELQQSVLPAIEKEFGRRVEAEVRSADDLPSVRRTPTLILQRGRTTRVIEGLPTVERLRGVIRDLETSP